MIQGAASVAMAMTPDVMVMASAGSTGTYPDSAISHIRTTHFYALVVRVRELHARLFPHIPVVVSKCYPRIRKACYRSHAGCPRMVMLPTSVRLLVWGIGLIDERRIGVRGVGFIDCGGYLLLEYICFG
jgi:hypothetical protein